MSMIEWAKNEIDIACKRERSLNDNPNEEWNYGVACYESAYKAFLSLMEDGHSGCSIGITKNILNRLIDCKPLTPIEDTPDIWVECTKGRESDYVLYQCKRMSSLFKTVYSDGSTKYKDINRFVCCYLNNPNICWHSGLIDKVLGELYPITMPYIPSVKPYYVYCTEGLTNQKNGDFDTVGIHHVITPEGDKNIIEQYFKEGGDDWIKIDVNEFNERMRIDSERSKDYSQSK